MSSVLYEVSDHLATITLNRPEASNAINGALRNELNAAWTDFLEDTDAWVAILTASGDVFCAGADLKDGAGSTGTFAGTFWEKPTINSFESGLELFKPTIAAVNGPCIGYGLTGVLFCDFVLASERATKEVAWRTREMGWIESVRFGETMRKVAGATDDATEGRRAWAEKRRPEWRGR